MSNVSGSGESHVPVYKIQEKGADSFYDAKGEIQKAGVTRTRITVGNTKDHRLSFAAKVISNSLWGSVKAFFAGSRYVELKSGDPDKRILLNINSIAKRCHLSKEEILRAAEKGPADLLRLIETAGSTSVKVFHALDEYDRQKRKIGLTPENCIRAIKYALEPNRIEKGLVVQTGIASFLLKLDSDDKMTFTQTESRSRKDADTFDVETGKITKGVETKAEVPVGPSSKKEIEPEKPGQTKKADHRRSPVAKKRGDPAGAQAENKIHAKSIPEKKPIKTAEDHFNTLMNAKVDGKNVFEIKGGQIYLREGARRLGLTKQVLMKTIGVAISNPPFTEILKVESKKKSRSYMIDYDPLQGRVSLLHVKQKTLGEGSFGRVLEVADFAEPRLASEALKIAHDEYSTLEKANKTIGNEFKLAQKFEPALGVPLRPRRVVKISGGEGLSNQTGYIAPKCDGDYHGHCKNGQVSNEDFLFEAYQIVSGVEAVTREKVVHKDYKGENVLVKYIEIDGKRSPALFLADFGDAADFSEGGDNWKDQDFIHTKAFTSYEDLWMANRLLDEAEKPGNRSPEKQQEIKDQLFALQQAQDVFSTGVMLYERFSGGAFPFSFIRGSKSREGYPDIRKNFKPPSIGKMPEIDKLLEGMLKFDPDERLTPSQVKKQFEAILSGDSAHVNTKEVRERIEKLKKALGYQ